MDSPFSTLSDGAVSLTLTYKQTCLMFCGLSIAAPLVLRPPLLFTVWQVALLCCCGLPRLVAMLDGCCSTVAAGVFGCSVRELLEFCRFAPGSVAGAGSLGLMRCPCYVHGHPDASFASGWRVLFPAVPAAVWLFPLCCLTGAPPIYSLFCLFSCMFVPLC